MIIGVLFILIFFLLLVFNHVCLFWWSVSYLFWCEISSPDVRHWTMRKWWAGFVCFQWADERQLTGYIAKIPARQHGGINDCAPLPYPNQEFSLSSLMFRCTLLIQYLVSEKFRPRITTEDLGYVSVSRILKYADLNAQAGSSFSKSHSCTTPCGLDWRWLTQLSYLPGPLVAFSFDTSNLGQWSILRKKKWSK